MVVVGSNVAAMEQKQSETSEYSENGVDLTLIRWMLSLTPAERLQVLQQFVNSVQEIRARNAD